MLPIRISRSKWFIIFVIFCFWAAFFGLGKDGLKGLRLNPIVQHIEEDTSRSQKQRRSEADHYSGFLDKDTGKDYPAQHTKPNYQFIPNLNKDLTKLVSVEVIATGYSAGIESTGKSPNHPQYGITYSGLKVIRDGKALSTIAADPKVFPLGTVLFIPGYGYGVVADTGSAIKGKKIDLYFNTKNQVYQEWGKKTVKVFVVKEGSGEVTEGIWNQLKNELLKPVSEAH